MSAAGFSGAALRASLTLLASFLAIRCTSPDAWEPALRVDSAGVEIVTNGSVDRPLAWQLERERVHGGADDGPESFFRVRVGFVDVDAAGNLYVLDPSSSRVVVFDSSGVARGVFGNTGEGPGEFLSANSISVTSDGITSVHDTRKRALVRFGPSGAVLPQIPFPFVPLRALAPHFRHQGDALVVLAREPFAGSDDRRVELLRIRGADTVPLFNESMVTSRTARYDACGMTLTLPMLFAPEMRWASNESESAIAAGAGYEIHVFRGDAPRRRVRREIQPRPVTREDALEVLRRRSIGGPIAPCNVSADEMLANHGYATAIQIVRAIALSPSGELWIRRERGVDGADGPIDVFDREGEYLGSLPAESPFPVLFLSDDRIAFREVDDLDVDRLVIARVLRK